MVGRKPVRRHAGRWALTVVGLLIATQTAGATLYNMEVKSSGARYQASADAQLDVAPAEVYAALVDFPELSEMNSAIRKVVVLRRVNAHSVVVYMETRACVAIFCSTLKQVQQFTELSPQDLVAITIPQGSNVKQGSSSWHLQADAGGTRLHCETTIEPDFWLPPFVGTALVRKALQEQGEAFMNGIERHAAEQRNAEWARNIRGRTL